MPGSALVYSGHYLRHDTGPHHPERADRLRAVYARLRDTGLLSAVRLLEPPPAGLDAIERVHDADYIERFARMCAQHCHFIDTPDCPICPASYDVARVAAGAGLQAVDAIMAGEIANAFCPVRPPGHHAERRAAMGFCFFNNIAIAAEHARAAHALERVAIVDFDVHHCNGTQHHFEADPDVLVCSIHQHPATLYPGTGWADEVGIGPGEGTIVNVPMVPGSGDADYRLVFEETILPAVRQYRPQFLLVSAGFDAHRDDPLARIELSTETFTWMIRQLADLAGSLCQGRLVSFLEGGYNLQALADCVEGHVQALCDAAG